MSLVSSTRTQLYEQLSMQSVCLEEVTSYKYLGVTCDSKLLWDLHTESVCSKLRVLLGKFYYIDKCADRATVYALYYALVDSVVSCGLSVYGTASRVHLDKIKSLQIRLIKYLVDKKRHRNREEILKISKILPVELKSKLLVLTENFNDNTYLKQRSFTYSTRMSNTNLNVVPSVTNFYGKRSRTWLIPTLHNELNNLNISNVHTKSQLKTQLKKAYLSVS